MDGRDVMSIVSVRGLTKVYRSFVREPGLRGALRSLFSRRQRTNTAVDALDFEIQEAEIVGFLGPNGAGKTTLIKMLSGILHPTTGRALVMGFVPWERRKQMKLQLSVVMGQKQQLWWDLPARESLRLNQYIYELPADKFNRTVAELCELMAVGDLLGVPVRQLSLGERMKFELIAALVHEPRVMFLDEPTIGLDILAQKRILEFLKHVNQARRTTILLTSHNLVDIQKLCPRVIIVNRGRLVSDGRLADLSQVLERKKIIRIETSQPMLLDDLERLGDVREFDPYRARVEVSRDAVRECAAALFARQAITDINIEDIPLEENLERIFAREALKVA
jgi:ABC-2 type transport system ATP-binding protein